MKYLNRDISWLSFNRRVLDVSTRDIPAAEKLSFIGITYSNLEEFMMVRYPSALDTMSKSEVKELVDAIKTQHASMTDRFREFNEEYTLIEEYDTVGSFGESSVWLKDYFKRNVLPALQPISVTEGNSFLPRSPVSVYVETENKKRERSVNYIEIPGMLDRFIQVNGSNSFVLIEDMIIDNLNVMFRGMTIIAACSFSILRSAEVYLKDDSIRKPYEFIKHTLAERNKSWITRLEVGTFDKELVGRVTDQLALDEDALVFSSDIVHLSDLKKIPDKIFSISDRRRKLTPTDPFPEESVFTYIRKNDRLAFHPYESYTKSVVRFIKEAADDPNVVSIKITLYRVADQSKIISALVKAASEGKQVTALIELQARFDEKHNIQVADILREAGVSLIYGTLGLKTHAKICLVSRKEKSGIRVYSHIGTGNYNESTAKIYTDYSYFTADKDIGYDLTMFFNLLTTPQEGFNSRKIIYAPYNLRETITKEIDKMIHQSKKDNESSIVIKCNSLTDDKIASKLVDAAKAGVSVSLIVRGSCILEPQKNLRIISIIGRFLEHSRVYYFSAKNCDSLYIGSSDIMYRNLNRRNELMIKVDNNDIKTRIKSHLDKYLSDTCNSYRIKKNYKFKRIISDAENDCQEQFINEVSEKEKKT